MLSPRARLAGDTGLSCKSPPKGVLGMHAKMENPSRRSERLQKKRENQAERQTRSVPLAFGTVEERERFRRMGEEAGYGTFNAYLLQLLHYATSGSIYPPEYVDGLRKEVEKLRSWLDQSRDENAELRGDLKQVRAQKETLLLLLNEQPTGPEVVARFLEQQARGVPK